MIRTLLTSAPILIRSSWPVRPVVNALLALPRQVRRILVAVVQVALAVASNYLAFALRFDGNFAPTLRMFMGTLPWLILARGGTLLLFRLDEGMWRYVGLWDLRRIATAVVTSTFVFFACVRWGYHTDDYPRSIFLIDTAFLLIFMGAFRLTPRICRDLLRGKGQRRVLIVGAGDTGERVLRELERAGGSTYLPVGFVDDNDAKIGQAIHGVTVFGTIKDLPEIVKRETPSEVVVAIPSAKPAFLRDIVTMLEPFNVSIDTAASAGGNGSAPITQTRKLSIEDLLSRQPAGLGVDCVRELIAGRRVLVTGAGGSIGSELSRQIAALEPKSLVLYERYENGLYEVTNSIYDGQRRGIVHSVIGDVTDETRLHAVFMKYRPEIVFHAAAHKHVPLMELNPCEAVKNNVTGTRMVAEAAARYGVERFILISTDKAVNPSSIMGATKRVAELVTRAMSNRWPTRFIAVRFGNVLGSNGSVLLRFQEQIKAGGPVTVTDPNITRYFMLIPEAVELVLHGAAVGSDGDTLVLDMGDQIRVLDLARNLIRLSGHVPDEEIPIVFTGLRPGEKLYEELVGERELIEPSPVEKISRIVPINTGNDEYIDGDLMELERSAAEGEVDAIDVLLNRLIPEFRRQSNLTPV